MDEDIGADLDSLVNLEQTFFDAGYEDGRAHGRIHGLIEGRALGREKGFEMWEELGFYEGFAMTWRAILIKLGRQDERMMHHITTLLDLIARFPLTNPSHPSTAPSSDLPSPSPSPSDPEFDILKLLRQIRSRYKILCSTLGVRPRVHAADGGSPPPTEDPDLDEHNNGSPSGPSAKKSKNSVWRVNNGGSAGGTKQGSEDFSF